MEGYLNYPGRVREGFLEEATPELSPQNKALVRQKQEESTPSSVDNKGDTQTKQHEMYRNTTSTKVESGIVRKGAKMLLRARGEPGRPC